MGVPPLTPRAAPAAAAGGFGFAPEPLRERVIRGEEVNSLLLSRSRCFSGGSALLRDGHSRSLGGTPTSSWAVAGEAARLGRRQGAGLALAAAGIVPAW